MWRENSGVPYNILYFCRRQMLIRGWLAFDSHPTFSEAWQWLLIWWHSIVVCQRHQPESELSFCRNSNHTALSWTVQSDERWNERRRCELFNGSVYIYIYKKLCLWSLKILFKCNFYDTVKTTTIFINPHLSTKSHEFPTLWHNGWKSHIRKHFLTFHINWMIETPVAFRYAIIPQHVSSLYNSNNTFI